MTGKRVYPTCPGDVKPRGTSDVYVPGKHGCEGYVRGTYKAHENGTATRAYKCTECDYYCEVTD